MSEDKNYIPKEEQSKAEQAINKKGNESDGKEINHQVKDKREKHQPRDTA